MKTFFFLKHIFYNHRKTPRLPRRMHVLKFVAGHKLKGMKRGKARFTHTKCKFRKLHITLLYIYILKILYIYILYRYYIYIYGLKKKSFKYPIYIYIYPIYIYKYPLYSWNPRRWAPWPRRWPRSWGRSPRAGRISSTAWKVDWAVSAAWKVVNNG